MSMIIKYLRLVFICLVTLLILTQCDTTTAEEYKAQAVGYVEQGDRTKAAEAYLKAAEKGDAESQFMVGALYFFGETWHNNPFSKNQQKALNFLKKSAQQEYGYAQMVLGLHLISEVNAESERKRGITYLENAIGNGDVLAGYFLGQLYDVDKDFKNKVRAAKCYEISYNKGCLSAGLVLSTLYLLNDDIFHNYMYGAQLFQECSEKAKNLGLDPLDVDSVLDYEMSIFLDMFNFFI